MYSLRQQIFFGWNANSPCPLPSLTDCQFFSNLGKFLLTAIDIFHLKLRLCSVPGAKDDDNPRNEEKLTRSVRTSESTGFQKKKFPVCPSVTGRLLQPNRH